MPPTYTDTARLQAIRALGVLLTITGGVALFLLGGQLLARDGISGAVGSLVVLVVGVALLLGARARLSRLWAANTPYLLSEDGTLALRGRQAFVARLALAGRLAMVLFLLFGIVFVFLFSAINCGERIDGFCGDVGRPPEWFVVVWQVTTLILGAAYVALVSLRRRLEDEAERIGVVVGEGQRRRRHDHPMDGTNRWSWE